MDPQDVDEQASEGPWHRYPQKEPASGTEGPIELIHWLQKVYTFKWNHDLVP